MIWSCLRYGLPTCYWTTACSSDYDYQPSPLFVLLPLNKSLHMDSYTPPSQPPLQVATDVWAHVRSLVCRYLRIKSLWGNCCLELVQWHFQVVNGYLHFRSEGECRKEHLLWHSKSWCDRTGWTGSGQKPGISRLVCDLWDSWMCVQPPTISVSTVPKPTWCLAVLDYKVIITIRSH